jgi:hypothetical protein
MEAPTGRRDDFIDPYFKGANPDEIVVILKAREPARIMTAIGDSKSNRWQLQVANRWIVQYNFYINDRQWGRMFVRICPYLPFSARVCLINIIGCKPDTRRSYRSKAMRQCLYQMLGPRASPATCGFAYRS